VATIEGVLASTTQSRAPHFVPLLLAGYWAAGCAAAFGPGYTIDKQEIHVQFVSEPQPAIHIDAEYRLRNTGNKPLGYLELRLPGRRRFHFAAPRVEWDAQSASFSPSQDNPRNVQLNFPEPWTISATHTLHLFLEYQPEAPGDTNLTFAPDGFFLPAEGWSPQLLPARGIFATGGVPPKKWLLTARVPDGFLVHMSGRAPKRSRHGGEQTIRAEQRPKDGYPFVIAGHFNATRFKAGDQTVNLWTRASQNAADLRPVADALQRASQAYNSMFGSRSAESNQLWIVECPVVAGCFTSSTTNYVRLIWTGDTNPSAEMAALDTVMVDLTNGTPEIAAAAAPSLASSWLGFGQNPGFYEQDPPLSALPAFAAASGREAVQGAQIRGEIIRHVLSLVPVRPATQKQPQAPEDGVALRAKSLLFFYGLQDRYGQDTFDKALSHMLYARRGGGFNLNDLIAAFEQETHQNVAEFVRLWMKHPGVPEEFRARYANPSAAVAVDTDTKESAP
jgi:hypothetical protein